jgi:quercetin dioxygenase-like cupin family protein
MTRELQSTPPPYDHEQKEIYMTPGFLRRDASAFYDKDGYVAQCLHNGENCVVIGSRVKAGGHAPPHHMHEYSDQLYYVTEGELRIQLGEETFTVAPESLVYIPRGTPHHNWNEGDIDEFHFEVLAPPPLPGQPVAVPTDSTDAGGRPYRVTPAAEVEEREPMPGLKMQTLLGRDSGSENVTLNVIEVAPGSSGPPMHIHEFDQFFFILAGEMTVEVALQKFVARPGDLVALPAGVPHTQYNEGSVPERHLALIAPSPAEDGRPWDVGVSFASTGESY